MPQIDFALYLVHAAFWLAFGATLLVLRSLDRKNPEAPSAAPVAQETKTARFSRALVAFHMFGFGLMYLGIANAVLPHRVPFWFEGQRLAGSLLIAAGAGLMIWARIFFRSWRFRAQLGAGHELATGGPFRFLRHPLYLGLSLLALGTAVWAPTATLWTAFALVAVGGDLRARAEERLLDQVFGAAYREYCAHTRRFFPGIY